MSALATASKLDGRGKGRNTIARELALEYAVVRSNPRILEHLPGVMNGLADKLSRRYQPGSEWQVPPLLALVPEASLPDRSLSSAGGAPTLSLLAVSVKSGNCIFTHLLFHSWVLGV